MATTCNPDACLYHTYNTETNKISKLVQPKSILPEAPDYAQIRKHLGWISKDRVKLTLKNTTQWYRQDSRLPLR